MTTKAQPMRPSPPLAPSVEGPPIDTALVAWLDHNAGSKMLDLPLHFADEHDLGRATLRNGGVELRLIIDSTALSMTLRDHLSSHCQRFPCTVWVRGTWGPLLPSPALHPAFTVRSVIGPATANISKIRWIP